MGQLLAYDDNKPIGSARVVLLQKDSRDGWAYRHLPEDQKLAAPASYFGSGTIRTYQNVDDQGRFEFHVGPGHFSVMESRNERPEDRKRSPGSASFFVNGEKELEFILRGDP